MLVGPKSKQSVHKEIVTGRMEVTRFTDGHINGLLGVVRSCTLEDFRIADETLDTKAMLQDLWSLDKIGIVQSLILATTK